MADQFSNIAEEIIHYQKKFDMPDTQLAFQLRMSVERLHDIKAMEVTPTAEEVKYIEENIK